MNRKVKYYVAGVSISLALAGIILAYLDYFWQSIIPVMVLVVLHTALWGLDG